MNKSIDEIIEKYINHKRITNIYRLLIIIIAMIIVFYTTYTLILPAIALTNNKQKSAEALTYSIRNESQDEGVVEINHGFNPLNISEVDIKNLNGKQYAILSATGKFTLTTKTVVDGHVYGDRGLGAMWNPYVMNRGVKDDFSFTFIAVNAENAQYKIYDSNNNIYLKVDDTLLTSTTDANDATVFTVKGFSENETKPNNLADPVLIQAENGQYINIAGSENRSSRLFRCVDTT